MIRQYLNTRGGVVTGYKTVPKYSGGGVVTGDKTVPKYLGSCYW